jgi:hypothetical protein
MPKAPVKKPAKKTGVPTVWVNQVLGADEDGVSEADVTDVANKHLPALEKCYSDGLKRDPSLGGEVNFMIGIGAGGKTTDLMIGGSSTLSDGPMIACCKADLLHWSFPPPKDPMTEVMLLMDFDNGK